MGRDGAELRGPLPLMAARTAKTLPQGLGWAFEPKFDGIRGCVSWARDGRPRLHSRQRRSLTAVFPEVLAAVAGRCTPGTVLDGEIVCWQAGTLDFTALLRRLGGVRTPHACFVVFDLLADAGEDLRGRPYRERSERLRARLDGCVLPLAVVPQTLDRDVATAWLTEHSEAGIEGVVAKRTDHHYATARNAWRKVRTRLSDEAIVGGVVGSPALPVALILGRLDDRAHLRVAGHTAPLPRSAGAELGRVLSPTGVDHPWPAALRPRFGVREPISYTRVTPQIVVELDVDTARDRGRWRHPVLYRRLRLDLLPQDLAAV